MRQRPTIVVKNMTNFPRMFEALLQAIYPAILIVAKPATESEK